MLKLFYQVIQIFLLFQINDLPKPSYIYKTLEELRIGTFANIETAAPDTSIIVALKKFVERRVSALPMIDEEGRLVDIFAKFDVIVSLCVPCYSVVYSYCILFSNLLRTAQILYAKHSCCLQMKFVAEMVDGDSIL